ncbi:glycerol-3-phosphate dehydrogenase [NAD(P)+] [Fulvitalea axinellae]|uniref:Glycerol-3-phosphate dehydrogenase [NAD(P)+] n=1 Tax=Fulvitalea axinellae TaxID=1182444 RepID=A0AAU9CMT2_9BACT|nr:glycerol-3-phosphate dehydrogenase [NAD(P)+] [Fulvitalea axinellae]
MGSKNISEMTAVGVIGAGSFGLAVANLLAENGEVLLYVRNKEIIPKINEDRYCNKQEISENIRATGDLKEVADNCRVIFPVVPSVNFRDMMRDLAPHLYPYHILIHGTKGLDFPYKDNMVYNRESVRTMSEIIREESCVVRVGCLAGPNLARELAEKQPAATVVASHFDEVIDAGQKHLRSDRFQVYGSSDLIGVELTGVLKNVLAIASGALSGLGYGENAKGLLISRGLVEMIYVGKVLGGNTEAFVGLAGVGDIVATCTSKLSRNFTVGYRLAQGESLEDIIESMDEVAEGVKTVKIVKRLSEHYGVRAPITEALYKVLYEGVTIQEVIRLLMKLPMNADIDFL